MRSDLIDLEARLVHQTPGAWLLDTGEAEPTWLPKSACEFDEDTGTLTLRRGLAEEKGLV
ncbi:hypothetical protein [Vannielia litorea]|uniref:hypothetical protein n=1 Tax=Vannielia litorea TaxID=1217970 RepID=UPI001BCBBB43|nr:hypothetical protein [Vannielia litorea]MBS8227137.1 hypothetical protein [Vannielia litorea]